MASPTGSQTSLVPRESCPQRSRLQQLPDAIIIIPVVPVRVAPPPRPQPVQREVVITEITESDDGIGCCICCCCCVIFVMIVVIILFVKLV
ncbi:hypothetical protein PMAYCL1PPCAC_27103 [Pristionchus mayeri]|uniref:Uncharacterized protein n=1 Tax=Pristionchus mayeri TaxID=1317129 RepID=A0AAN5I8U6_9BILA|nr:hypothetical protein PMAYCL1PPCAC_27103 [Pristionchus mayeri]